MISTSLITVIPESGQNKVSHIFKDKIPSGKQVPPLTFVLQEVLFIDSVTELPVSGTTTMACPFVALSKEYASIPK
jgi:hypothetical protein